jgi:hypothetical protein
MPAVFIEFKSINIATVGNNDQDISLQIILHIAVETLAESYQDSYKVSSVNKKCVKAFFRKKLIYYGKNNHYTFAN